jgi:hypothetical protein
VRGRRSASEARPGCSERATAPLADRANINEELVDAARLQVAELQRSKDSGPGGPTVELKRAQTICRYRSEIWTRLELPSA